MKMTVYSGPSVYRKVEFPKGTIGWLVNTPSILFPKVVRTRVYLNVGWLDSHGRMVYGSFTMGGKRFLLNKYREVVKATSYPKSVVLTDMEIWVNAKWLREDSMKRAAEWACNPESETYRSM